MVYSSKVFNELIQCDPKVAYFLLGFAIIAWAVIYGASLYVYNTLNNHGHNATALVIQSIVSAVLLIIPAAFGINFLIWGAAHIIASILIFIALVVIGIVIVCFG